MLSIEYQKAPEGPLNIESPLSKTSPYFIRSSIDDIEIINPRLDNQLSIIKWIIFFPLFLLLSPFIFLCLIIQIFCIKDIIPTRIYIKKDNLRKSLIVKRKLNLSCYCCYSYFTKNILFSEIKRFIFKKDGEINDLSSPYNGIRGGIFYENKSDEMVKLIDIIGIPKEESEYIIRILNSYIEENKA
jgi:hypothetical protein